MIVYLSSQSLPHTERLNFYSVCRDKFPNTWLEHIVVIIQSSLFFRIKSPKILNDSLIIPKHICKHKIQSLRFFCIIAEITNKTSFFVADQPSLVSDTEEGSLGTLTVSFAIDIQSLVYRFEPLKVIFGELWKSQRLIKIIDHKMLEWPFAEGDPCAFFA